MAAILGISRGQTNLIRISWHHISHYFNINNCLKQLYISNKKGCLVMKMNVACVGVICALRHLKERVA